MYLGQTNLICCCSDSPVVFWEIGKNFIFGSKVILGLSQSCKSWGRVVMRMRSSTCTHFCPSRLKMPCRSGHLSIRLLAVSSPKFSLVLWTLPSLTCSCASLSEQDHRVSDRSAIDKVVNYIRSSGFVWIWSVHECFYFFVFPVGRSIFRLKESEQQQINLVWPYFWSLIVIVLVPRPLTTYTDWEWVQTARCTNLIAINHWYMVAPSLPLFYC